MSLKEKAFRKVDLEELRDDLAFITGFRSRLVARQPQDKQAIELCDQITQTIKRKLLREVYGKRSLR